MKKIKNISCLLFLAILVLSLFNTPNVEAAEFNSNSKTIYTFPTDASSDYTAISPAFSLTGEQFISNRLTSKWVSSVIYNGKEITDNFKTLYAVPKFSPDGKNYVYFASYSDNRDNAANYHVILNGKEYKNYANISAAQFIFSANSQHNAFPATANGKMFIVYDKQEQTKYDVVSAPSLSPDGKILTYSAKNNKDKKTSLIINAKVVGTYEEIKYPIVFSPNSTHIAYAVKDGQWSLYVDYKKVSSTYDDIVNISITNSGKYAFIGKKGNDYVANISGKESPSYTSMSGLVISPDEKQSIFIARKGNNEMAVINNQEGTQYPIFMGGSIPVFSPDSQHLVYKTSRFSSDGKSRIFLFVVDGQEMTANGFYYNGFDQGNGVNSEFVFSSDSRYLYYYSLKNKNTIVKNEIDLTGVSQKVVTSEKIISAPADSKTEIVSKTPAAATSSSLKGRILLQVESHGEAWYVNPKDGLRYYMSNGDEALKVMKKLGIGVSNKDIDRMKTDASFRKRLIGKILLQVESHGEAYYISFDGRYNYLKDGNSALAIMKKLGLGITNKDLEKINTIDMETNSRKAIAEVKSIQTAIEMYYNDNNYYPSTLSLITPYLKKIGINNLPQSPNMNKTVCPNYNGYNYIRIGESDWRKESTYTLKYCIEVPLTDIGLKAGFSTASPSGWR